MHSDTQHGTLRKHAVYVAAFPDSVVCNNHLSHLPYCSAAITTARRSDHKGNRQSNNQATYKDNAREN